MLANLLKTKSTAAPAEATAPISFIFRETGALHPIMFLAAHLTMFHLTARVFPKKQITYPLYLALSVLLFASEHLAAELPTLAEAGPAFGGLFFLSIPCFFYCAFKKTAGPKALVWAGLALFLGAVPVFAGLELGVPKDVIAEQKLANFDPHYANWHMLLHAVICTALGLGVPKDVIAEQKLANFDPHYANWH